MMAKTILNTNLCQNDQSVFQPKRVAVISDVSTGYGTPQILSLAQSMAKTWGAETLLLEPDEPDRPLVHLDAAKGVGLHRIYTASHPYSASGSTEFNVAAQVVLEKFKPDLLVFAAFLGSPVILKLKHKPSLIIYYGIEHTDNLFLKEQKLFNLVSERIDIGIFCEENRALLDRPRLGLEKKPSVILYNGSLVSPSPLSAKKRNKKFFYGGLIDPQRTFGDWFLDGPLDDYTIDMYGPIRGFNDVSASLRNLYERGSLVSYKGHVATGEPYFDLLKNYNYSIVIWVPDRESTLYAAPNKFFDAIAAGVPPIVAPHPMCVKIVERYQCGLVMNAWTHDGIRSALDKALSIVGTSQYARMVEGCKRAQVDLNWDAQFSKLKKSIDIYWAQKSS